MIAGGVIISDSGGGDRSFCLPPLEYDESQFRPDPISPWSSRSLGSCTYVTKDQFVQCLTQEIGRRGLRINGWQVWGNDLHTVSRMIETLGTYQEAAKMAVPNIVEIIEETDSDLDPVTLMVAITALGRIRDPRAAETLRRIALDGHEFSSIRSDAIKALEQTDPSTAVPTIFEISRDHWMWDTLLASLGRIGPASLPYIQPYYLKATGAHHRRTILEAADNVGECHGYGALVYILPFLEQLATDSQSPPEISTKATEMIDRIREEQR